MASSTDHHTPVAVAPRLRQLLRIRAFYAGGSFLWAVTAAWTWWESPGSRQMWASVLLLSVFSGLLLTTSLWVRRLEHAGTKRPVHHAAPRTVGRAQHARP